MVNNHDRDKYCFCCKKYKPKYHFQSEIKGLRAYKFWCLICIAKLIKHGGRFI